MPYLKIKRNNEICIYKRGADGQPEGESLGCHPSEEAANKQIAAIWANEATAFRQREGELWLDRATMATLCPDCAHAMEQAGLDRLNVRAMEQMPEQMKQGLCASIGGDPGFFESCMSKSFGDFDPGDKESFCAWLHHECVGIWPGEHEAVIETAPSASAAREAFTNQRDTLAVDLQAADPTGHVWEVVIIGPNTPQDVISLDGQTYIRSKNGRLYSTAALEAAAPLFDGVKSYDDHLTDREFAERSGMRPPGQDWLASLVEPRWDRATNSLRAVYKIVDDAFAQKLLRAKQLGVLDTIGLSLDVFEDGVMRAVNGVKSFIVNTIRKVNSVDAVGEPAAGGGFVRLLESIQQTHRHVEAGMEELLKQLEQLAAAIDASMLSEEDKSALKASIEEIKKKYAEAPAEGAPAAEAAQRQAEAQIAFTTLASFVKRKIEAAGKQKPAPQPDPVAEAQKILDQANAAAQRIIEAARVADSQHTLDTLLAASGLTAKAKEVIRKQYAGRAFEAVALQATIEDQRSILIDIDEEGKVTGHARPRITVGRVTEADRFSLAFLRLMAGSTKFDQVVGDLNKVDAKGRPVFKALQEAGQLRAIEAWVADGKPNLPRARRLSEWYYDFADDDGISVDVFAGKFGRRALEANLTTTTMASIVKNSVNLLLAASYSVRQKWWEPIVFEEDVDTIDQATLVRVFGITTLPIVSEGGAYTELSMPDEEETASFFKRGGYVGVTLETFLRDKLNQLRQIPDKLANAWYNSLSARVAAVFTTNSATGPVLSDSGALYNNTAATSAGGHANLLTTALSHAAWDAVVTAMLKQTDQPLGAGERLGMENKPGYMLVPVNLRNTALEIRNSQYVPGSGNLTTNQYKEDFEVVVVPTWTDATDWAALAMPSGMSPIHLIYVRGRRTPELFTADTEEGGAMFTNDTLRFKARQFAAEFSATYPVAPVADWRSLHKNNVAG